jgi:hypothetical protein
MGRNILSERSRRLMSPFKLVRADSFPVWQIEAIGEHMLRDEDKRELESLSNQSSGLSLVDAVFDEDSKSWIAYGRKTAEVVAVFGRTRSNAMEGRIIWMVGTPKLYKYVPEFLDVSKRILDYWLEKYGRLHNYIDLRNLVHISWLMRLGFTLPPGQTVKMHDGVPFQYFIKEK